MKIREIGKLARTHYLKDPKSSHPAYILMQC